MKRVPVSATVPDVERLHEAADVLRSGGVVAYPTDTLYGLAVDPRNERAVRQLYRIKGRLVDRAIPLIAADRAQVEAHAGPLPAEVSALAEAFWPGPLALMVRAWPDLAASLLSGRTHAAVRVPAHALARGLAGALRHPVTSTSANLSGWPPTADPDEVARSLGDDLELLLDGGAAPGGPPSTLVDTTSGELVVLREGAVPTARLIEAVPGLRCLGARAAREGEGG